MDFKTASHVQKLKLKSKDKEIQRLKEALRVLLLHDDSDQPSEDDEPTECSETITTPTDDTSEVEEDDLFSELPEPVRSDDAYRCLYCAFEVVDGECQSCGMEHQWSLAHDTAFYDSVAINLAIHSDRSLIPRGDTPLQILEDVDYLSPPADYFTSADPVERECRFDEYKQLLKRGATPLMCETFHLEFTYEGGIYAWADEDIYEQFAGPQMQLGDFWKIHLGRCVKLDKGDYDGSEFVANLLEDALFFPLRDEMSFRDYEKWQTVEETPGIWVTRLMGYKDSANGQDSDLDSDVEDVDMCWEARAEAEDDALEFPVERADGPIQSNDYMGMNEGEDEDEDGDEDYFEDSDSPEVVLSLGVDSAWISDEDTSSTSDSEESDSAEETGTENF